MKLEYRNTDLARLVRLVAAHFDVLAAENRIAYSVETPAELQAQVDLEKFQRLLEVFRAHVFNQLVKYVSGRRDLSRDFFERPCRSADELGCFDQLRDFCEGSRRPAPAKLIDGREKRRIGA